MKFSNKYKLDNFILSITPLLLLNFTKTPEQNALILCIILSNIIYWNNKNMFTWILDILFANILIIYILYNLIVKGLYNKAIIFIISILYFYKESIDNITNNKRQIYYHIAFRFFILMGFIEINKSVII